MGSDKARPATVQDVDEGTGEAVQGTRRRAVTREKPKVHREKEGRSERKSRRTQSGDTGYPPEQASGATQHIEVRERDAKQERRKSSSNSIKSPRKSTRPPSSHDNRPKISIPSSSSRPGPDPSYYGIPTPTITRTPATTPSVAIPMRPRAQTSQTYPRPLSYHSTQTSNGGYGPPLSNSAFYQPPLITPSYPPPSPSSSYMRYAITPQQQAPQQHQLSYSAQPQYALTSGADYFSPQATSRPLSSRFDSPIARTGSAIDPIPRTASAFGTRDYPQQRALDIYDAGYYNDTYASDAEGPATIRKRDRQSIRVPSSASVTSRADRDRDADLVAMPPPRRPGGILRRPQTEYTLDAPRQTQIADYRDTHDTRTQFSDEREARTQFSDEPRPRARRPSMTRHSVSYDLGPENVRIESANSGRRRKSTFYDQPSSAGTGASSAYEEKLHQATSYQEDVAGPNLVPLTAEYLKKQQRRQAGSSRSTKSSASRDESDYKKSATTRTTRSGSGNDDENVTIKVTGQARVMVGGAQIDCTEGGEIEIKRQKSLRMGGSERSNSEYGQNQIEDRRSRVSRPVGRSRMSSQSGSSYTRTPQYPREEDGYF